MGTDRITGPVGTTHRLRGRLVPAASGCSHCALDGDGVGDTLGQGGVLSFAWFSGIWLLWPRTPNCVLTTQAEHVALLGLPDD